MSEKVSIIIPAYNVAKYVRQAIDSALSQTHQNIEVVIVDDGSTDDTCLVIKSMRDPRIHYIHQSNAGQSLAINRGVAISNGKYIKLLDADDWINPEHIESQLNSLKGFESSIASCRWGYFANDPKKPILAKEYSQKDYCDPLGWYEDSMVKDEGMMGGWMWLIPRPVWDRCGGYDPSLTLYNDVHFSAKLVLACDSVRFASDAVYSYRRASTGSMSMSRNRQTKQSIVQGCRLASQLLLARRESSELRVAFANRLQYWVYQFYPEAPDLVDEACILIAELGGSSLRFPGGRAANFLAPVIGWKGVRRLQGLVSRIGWEHIRERKHRQRSKMFE